MSWEFYPSMGRPRSNWTSQQSKGLLSTTGMRKPSVEQSHYVSDGDVTYPSNQDSPSIYLSNHGSKFIRIFLLFFHLYIFTIGVHHLLLFFIFLRSNNRNYIITNSISGSIGRIYHVNITYPIWPLHWRVSVVVQKKRWDRQRICILVNKCIILLHRLFIIIFQILWTADVDVFLFLLYEKYT